MKTDTTTGEIAAQLAELERRGAADDDDGKAGKILDHRATMIRSFTFDTEFAIRSGGDGRTVEGYAAPFDEEAEIFDIEGHYFELFRKGAFGRSIKKRTPQVFFNHGMDLFLRPSERFSMPIGLPLELKEDGKGLFTVTRYAKTELADEVLQLIDEGVIRGQSVQIRRTPSGQGTRRTLRGHRASGLDLVERLDVNLVEYGPTPIPIFAGAEITKVRSGLAYSLISDFSDEERSDLAELLRAGPVPAASGPVPEAEHEQTSAGPVPADEILRLRHARTRIEHEETTR